MIFVDLTILVTAYITTGLLLVFFLWLYYDRRDRDRYEALRSPTVFVCVKCSQIYAVPGRQSKEPCPRCEHQNIPLRF